jgi:hypothetical protein
MTAKHLSIHIVSDVHLNDKDRRKNFHDFVSMFNKNPVWMNKES